MGSGTVLSVCSSVERGLIDHTTGLSLLEAQLITSGLVSPDLRACLDLEDALKQQVVDESTYRQLQVLNEANKHLSSQKYTSEPLPVIAALKEGVISEYLAIKVLEIQLATGGLRTTSSREVFNLDRAVQHGLIPADLLSKLGEDQSLSKLLIDPNTSEKLSLIQLMQRSVVHEETGLRVLPVKPRADGSIWLKSGKQFGIVRAAHEGAIDRETMLRLLGSQLCAGGIVDPKTGSKLTVEEALSEGLIDQETASGVLNLQVENGGIVDPHNGKKLTVDEAVQCNLMSSTSALLVLEKQKGFMGLLWPHSGEILTVTTSLQHEIITDNLASELICNRHKIAAFYIPESSEVIDIDSANKHGLIDEYTAEVLKTVEIPDSFPDIDDLNKRFSSWLVWRELQLEGAHGSSLDLGVDEEKMNTPSPAEARQLFISYLMMNSYMDPKTGQRLLVFDGQLNKMAKVLMESSSGHGGSEEKTHVSSSKFTDIALDDEDEIQCKVVNGSSSAYSEISKGSCNTASKDFTHKGYDVGEDVEKMEVEYGRCEEFKENDETVQLSFKSISKSAGESQESQHQTKSTDGASLTKPLFSYSCISNGSFINRTLDKIVEESSESESQEEEEDKMEDDVSKVRKMSSLTTHKSIHVSKASEGFSFSQTDIDTDKNVLHITEMPILQIQEDDTTGSTTFSSELTRSVDMITECPYTDFSWDEKNEREFAIHLLRAQVEEGGILDVTSGKRYGLDSALDKGIVDEETVLEVLALQFRKGRVVGNPSGTMSTLQDAVLQGLISSQVALQIMEQQNLLGGFYDSESQHTISVCEALENGIITDEMAHKILHSHPIHKAIIDPDGSCLHSVSDAQALGMLDEEEAENMLNQKQEKKVAILMLDLPDERCCDVPLEKIHNRCEESTLCSGKASPVCEVSLPKDKAKVTVISHVRNSPLPIAQTIDEYPLCQSTQSHVFKKDDLPHSLSEGTGLPCFTRNGSSPNSMLHGHNKSDRDSFEAENDAAEDEKGPQNDDADQPSEAVNLITSEKRLQYREIALNQTVSPVQSDSGISCSSQSDVCVDEKKTDCLQNVDQQYSAVREGLQDRLSTSSPKGLSDPPESAVTSSQGYVKSHKTKDSTDLELNTDDANRPLHFQTSQRDDQKGQKDQPVLPSSMLDKSSCDGKHVDIGELQDLKQESESVRDSTGLKDESHSVHSAGEIQMHPNVDRNKNPLEHTAQNTTSTESKLTLEFNSQSMSESSNGLFKNALPGCTANQAVGYISQYESVTVEHSTQAGGATHSSAETLSTIAPTPANVDLNSNNDERHHSESMMLARKSPDSTQKRVSSPDGSPSAVSNQVNLPATSDLGQTTANSHAEHSLSLGMLPEEKKKWASDTQAHTANYTAQIDGAKHSSVNPVSAIASVPANVDLKSNNDDGHYSRSLTEKSLGPTQTLQRHEKIVTCSTVSTQPNLGVSSNLDQSAVDSQTGHSMSSGMFLKESDVQPHPLEDQLQVEDGTHFSVKTVSTVASGPASVHLDSNYDDSCCPESMLLIEKSPPAKQMLQPEGRMLSSSDGLPSTTSKQPNLGIPCNLDPNAVDSYSVHSLSPGMFPEEQLASDTEPHPVKDKKQDSGAKQSSAKTVSTAASTSANVGLGRNNDEGSCSESLLLTEKPPGATQIQQRQEKALSSGGSLSNVANQPKLGILSSLNVNPVDNHTEHSLSSGMLPEEKEVWASDTQLHHVKEKVLVDGATHSADETVSTVVPTPANVDLDSYNEDRYCSESMLLTKKSVGASQALQRQEKMVSNPDGSTSNLSKQPQSGVPCNQDRNTVGSHTEHSLSAGMLPEGREQRAPDAQPHPATAGTAMPPQSGLLSALRSSLNELVKQRGEGVVADDSEKAESQTVNDILEIIQKLTPGDPQDSEKQHASITDSHPEFSRSKETQREEGISESADHLASDVAELGKRPLQIVKDVPSTKEPMALEAIQGDVHMLVGKTAGRQHSQSFSTSGEKPPAFSTDESKTSDDETDLIPHSDNLGYHQCAENNQSADMDEKVKCKVSWQFAV